MSYNEIDTNIDNYSISDLKNVYKLKDNHSINDIYNYHNYLIDKCKNYIDLLYFFEQCKNRLCEDYYKKHINSNINNNINESFINMNDNINKQIPNDTINEKIPNEKIPNGDINEKIINEQIMNEFKPLPKKDENIITKLIIINSKFRNNFSNTLSNDFIIELPYILNNVVSLRFKSIESINSAYAINKNRMNNIFYIDGNIITIPEGNYTSIELLDEINKLILPYNVVVSFNEYSAKVTFTSTTDTNFTLDFNVDNLEFYSTFGYILGFRKNPPILSNTYTGESILNIRGDTYFYIYLNDYNSTYDNIISLRGENYIYKNIIGRITNVADIYNIQFEDSSDRINKIRYYYGKGYIRRLNIRLLDENGNLLDNNNTDYSLTLEIEQRI